MEIIWYSSGQGSSCEIIGNNLNKFSKNKYVKTRWKESIPEGDVFIGSYRYFDDDMIYRHLLDIYKQEQLYIFAHGISKIESENLDIFVNNWQERAIKCNKILVSCKYAQDLFKKAEIDTDILPFGVNTKIFVPEPYEEFKHVVFGMAFAQGKGHRKGQEFALNLTREHGIKIVFAHYDHTEMSRFYNSIDCLLVLSEEDGRETFCLPILESGACATPVFSTRVGIAEEVIKTGVSGIICKKDEMLGNITLYSKMLNDDRGKLLKMGMELHKEVFLNWSWENVTKKWDEYFK